MRQTRIRERRLERGLTQEQLADKVGVTQAAVTLWETGQTMPRANLLRTLANALDCTVDYLIGGTDDEAADC